MSSRVIDSKCVWVGDGDTLKTSDGETIRLLGINAPELAHVAHGKVTAEPYGQAAADFLKAAVEGESIVLIVSNSRERDVHGRLLALVQYKDSAGTERMANEELVEAGLAHLFFMDDAGFLNRSAWIQVQREAKIAKRGVWSLSPDRYPALASDTRNEAHQSIFE